jgi:hypothetical protein
LEALKKLEKEASKQDEVQPWPEIDVKTAIQRRVQGTLLLNRFFSSLLVIVVFALGGWLVFGRKMPLPDRPGAPDVLLVKTSNEPVEAASITNLKRPAEPTVAAEKKDTVPIKPESLPKEEIRRPLLISQERIALKSMEKPRAPEMESREPFPKRPFEESSFKLEAVIWSNDPKNRFAVINGRIIRAGGSIGGMPVYHIGRDYVTFGLGNGERKLKFRRE